MLGGNLIECRWIFPDKSLGLLDMTDDEKRRISQWNPFGMKKWFKNLL